MRVDVVTIIPEYLAPLELSLLGKARAKGLMGVHTHDLRDFTTDRHRTVDDTPYGGGAGMVMKPEPWRLALEHVAAQAEGTPHLLVPSPAGTPFTQAMAASLATEPWLVFACGRYEGIDERVFDWASDRMPVTHVSLGDYVLNGGEVAALAVIEAVGRLIPGVVGNPDSLVEESHNDGLLEYPVYTKPAQWEGLSVPEVLLSGNHAAIDGWRLAQQRQRTVARRPDLLASTTNDVSIRLAVPADAPEILVLQRACWVQEALANDSLGIPALHESLEDVRRWLGEWTTLVARDTATGRLVGGVRGQLVDDTGWDIGRLMVAPDLQGHGLGRRLLESIEALAPEPVTSYLLFTGAKSVDNQRMYRKAGYRVMAQELDPEDALHWAGRVRMSKRRR